MKTVKFYTTTGCHLCDEAYAMMMHLNQESIDVASNIDFQIIEISCDDTLIEKYGIRIPVLTFESKELSWPFAIEELYEWLSNF